MWFISILDLIYSNIKYYGIAVILIGLTAIFLNKKTRNLKLPNNLYEDNQIYIVLRGTETKAGLIVNQFNIYDSNPSHIGIGIYKNDDFLIYNVSDNYNEKRKDNLFIETLEDFVSVDGTVYYSIWKVNNLSFNEFEKIDKKLEESVEKKYIFDKYITLNNNEYYCTEYVVEMLSDKRDFEFTLREEEINGVVKLYLKRDSLIYYPVDGFIKDNQVTKIYEWKKSE